jgi:hypothetical protein
MFNVNISLGMKWPLNSRHTGGSLIHCKFCINMRRLNNNHTAWYGFIEKYGSTLDCRIFLFLRRTSTIWLTKDCLISYLMGAAFRLLQKVVALPRSYIPARRFLHEDDTSYSKEYWRSACGGNSREYLIFCPFCYTFISI